VSQQMQRLSPPACWVHSAPMKETPSVPACSCLEPRLWPEEETPRSLCLRGRLAPSLLRRQPPRSARYTALCGRRQGRGKDAPMARAKWDFQTVGSRSVYPYSGDDASLLCRYRLNGNSPGSLPFSDQCNVMKKGRCAEMSFTDKPMPGTSQISARAHGALRASAMQTWRESRRRRVISAVEPDVTTPTLLYPSL
jgi:hypothetical protein